MLIQSTEGPWDWSEARVLLKVAPEKINTPKLLGRRARTCYRRRFGMGVEGYWARRRDGLGGVLIDQDPGELQRMVSDDYAMRPTPRRPNESGSR